MNSIASYFDGKSAHSTEINIQFYDDGHLLLSHQDHQTPYYYKDVKFSSRLGNTPRIITLPDNSTCHIDDNDMVDAFLKKHKAHLLPAIIFALEDRITYVVTAVIFTVFFTWAMITYAIPTAATAIANNIPESVQKKLGHGTLETLDRIVFNPSQLDESTKNRLLDRFSQMQNDINISNDYTLIFRHSEKIGANAFALPSGIIVITDGLVDVSENDDELVSILAHEIGHLIHHHSTRMAIQSSAIAVLIATITGDPFSTSSILVALPTVLINSKYSRTFETEADDFAYQYMSDNNIALEHFASILERITETDGDSEVESYISSHPETRRRVQRFK
ncbi:hypothetical protein MNBD_GAMMA05-424 [hydrothermal vent metagenome]|uniref:Uncharacterized protein n=1 Tax=hydrothermal vent metagenome TaxID=652676 RepID=A0A3B0WE41_9ZZZZ